MKTFPLLLAALLAFLSARADKVLNGNDVARWYAEGDAAKQSEVRKASEGGIHSFRFLEIKSIENPAASGRGAVVTTVEPGSEMTVVLKVNTNLSMKLLGTLQVGDAVAAQGRITTIGTPAKTLTVDPAQLRYKAKLAPKAGKELLRDVDPRAN